MNDLDYEQYQRERTAFWRRFRLEQCIASHLTELTVFLGSRLEHYLSDGELLYTNGDYRFPEQRRKDRPGRPAPEYLLAPKELEAYTKKFVDALDADSFRMLLKPGESIQSCFAGLVEPAVCDAVKRIFHELLLP